MWADMNQSTRDKHRVAVRDMMAATGMSRAEIEASGPSCSGFTLLQGIKRYSVACVYDKRINIATTGQEFSNRWVF